MNIFVLSRNPELCARWHHDRHCVQMIREYHELLSWAHRVLDGHKALTPFVDRTGRRRNRVTWQHPDSLMDARLDRLGIMGWTHVCARWARSSRGNYEYLYQLLLALGREYTYRYGRVHSYLDTVANGGRGTVKLLAQLPRNMPSGPMTPPALAMHPSFLRGGSLQSYRDCYRFGKHAHAVWSGRDPPPWYMVGDMELHVLPPSHTHPRYRVRSPSIEIERTPRGKLRGIRPQWAHLIPASPPHECLLG